MKVKYEDSIEYKVWKFIEGLGGNIVLRSDLSGLAMDRQITRALNSLVEKNRLAKIGYGVYAKLQYSELGEMFYMPGGLLGNTREALTRLGIRWTLSAAEQDYNGGLTQQVPVSPRTKLLDRFRRKLTYAGREMRFE